MNTISEPTLKKILNAANIGLCLLDKEAYILDSDALFLDIFHYQSKNLIHKNISLLFEDMTKFLAWYETYLSCIEDKDVVSEYFTFKTSQNKFILCRCTLQRDNSGAILSVQEMKESSNESLKTLYEEIESLQKTKQYYLEANIQKTQHIQQRDTLMVNQAKLAAMGEIIGAIAHQWKQPLSQINSILLDIQGLFPVDIQRNHLDKRLDDIEELTLHMAETIEDFRAYVSPQKEKNLFAFADALDDARRILSSASSINEIKFEVNYLDDISLYGYKKEFIHSLLIFFNNSKDAFISNNILNRHIKITTRQIKENKIIRIVDNAGGIDEKVLTHVFEPYFSTKKDEGGTGLGLYMAKLLIEDSMNCKLKINSIDNTTEITIIILGLKNDS